MVLKIAMLALWWSCQSASPPEVCLDGPVSLLQWSRPSTELDDDTFGAFVPVDGGTGRTCRAVEADEAANTDTDREIFSAANIGACKMLCQGTLGCVGINYHAPSTHCELWSSVELTSEASVNHTCLRFAQDADFLPVHGGSHRACGEDAEHAYLVEKSLSLSHCKMSCKENKTCVGVEYGRGGSCKLWTSFMDVQSSVQRDGSTCLKKEFTHVDSEKGVACASSDHEPKSIMQISVTSLEACKETCRQTLGCMGLDFSVGRCDIWTGLGGIQAGEEIEDHVCLRHHGHLAPPAASEKQRNARFLIRATFGPTLKSLEELKVGEDAWIDEQMALPPSLHRAYYRQRTNPGHTLATAQSVEWRSRCSRGSRWANYAILPHDHQQPITVENNQIFINGSFRSDIDVNYAQNGLQPPLRCSELPPTEYQEKKVSCASQRLEMLRNKRCNQDPVWVEDQSCQQSCFDIGLPYSGDDCSLGWASFRFTGYVCDSEPFVGGMVQLSQNEDCVVTVRLLNPRVWKSDANVVSGGMSFDIFKPGILLLNETKMECNLGRMIRADVEEPGRFYVLDDRLELLENTLSSPTTRNSAGSSCSTVPRSFLNEDSCRLLPGCSPLTQELLLVPLTVEHLSQFHTVGGRYVYVVSGLRATASPCDKISRWKKLSCGAGCTASSLEGGIGEQLSLALANEEQQGDVRDIDVFCSGVDPGVTVQVREDFFQHVHGDENNVYDFTDWVLHHPGGPSRITQFASTGFILAFPSWHGMDRWDRGLAAEVVQPNFVGRYGETVYFHNLPESMQTPTMASFLGESKQDLTFSEVCGSPGEVANDPWRGHQYTFLQDHHGDSNIDGDTDFAMIDRLGKTTVWTMHALYAKDQLRQRMAWALAQIYVIRAQHDPEVEAWVNYYDIFVRHAFGNLRDILREVTYNAEMGGFLNARGNRAKDRTGREPNENYAREVMQLFTIGLWKLNPDGSWKLNEEGEPIASYGQEDIMNFARVFTGLDYNIRRGNIEHTDGRNRIDPMRMNEWHHDIYPKTNLNGGYLGDGYPICSEAPEGSFLAQGARYNFVGKELPGEDFKVLRLEPTSELYQALCFASSGSSGHCRYNLTVQLADTLACHGAECTLEAKEVKFLNVSGGFYEYLEPTCVNLYFFSGMYSRHGGENWATDAQCRDVEHEKMGFECCDGCFKWFRTDEMRAKGLHCHSYRAWPEMYTEKCNHDPDWSYHKYCELHCWERGVGYGYNCSYGKFVGVRPCQYRREFVSFKEAQARCKALGLPLCRRNLRGKGCDYDRAHVWIDEACTEQVVVYPDGTVSSNSTKLSKFNPFSVNWKDGRWPKVQEGFCPGGCFAVGTVCSCNVTLEVRPVFATTPTASELAKLKIGAHPPTEDRCTSCGGEVRAYGSGDANTVFEYQGNFYSNKENLVVFHGGFEFRNPPVFMPRSGARPRHALAEVEELLDHLFHHPNTAPFISRLLIQRFGASSPSQEYILAVANAFKTGSYNGKTYSGRYGDLAATLAAILLHREGGSPLARTEGALREPILKLVHLMRSLEYRDLKDRPVVLGDLQDLMGQLPYAAPTVFNFYHSDYRPDSFPERMAAPEFEIFDPPRIVNFMNGMISLVDSGLSNCWRGFGRPAEACKAGELEAENLDCIGDTLEQLDLLLTGGRLQQSQSMLKGRALVKDSYERHGADRYKAAQKAILFSAEFNVIGNPLPQGLRPALNPQPPQTPMKDYKAVVLLYLSGGVDSFNMLVPMDCPLYEEYLEAREDVALDVGELHKITAANQVCSTFGLRPMLTAFKELYDEGHLAFAANVGSLAEPVNKTSYLHSDKKKCVNLHSHSDQTRGAMTLKCQSISTKARGGGGRMADALAAGQLPTMSFSMDGYAIWPSGRETIPNIVGTSHVSLRQREQLQAVVDNITSIRHGNFYFEEYNRRVAAALQLDADLTKYLRNSLLKTSFEANDFDLTRQLRQVARLIAVREKRQVQRDVFFVRQEGYDHHTSLKTFLDRKFSELNHALTQFTQELKAQGVFESVVLATQSDFARTLTPNSQRGTDHGWAGHYVLLGGGIKGGQIFNQYPSSLKLDSELDLGRGRLVPKHPYENFLVPIAEWMGVELSQMKESVDLGEQKRGLETWAAQGCGRLLACWLT
ncbi:unnamed protein product [Durusdinium trenchii]|uniref:Uncharacterized protein n=1 Tax=Durusdinium trenchii TaxID=1381693 RepID=A0ABP0S2X3_9DINO